MLYEWCVKQDATLQNINQNVDRVQFKHANFGFTVNALLGAIFGYGMYQDFEVQVFVEHSGWGKEKSKE